MLNVELMMSMMLMGFIALIVLELIKNTNGFILITGTILLMVLLFTNIPTGEKLTKYNTITIHSTAANYNNITGEFLLGTGYIESTEMYTGNIFDGEVYERVYIPVASTKRKPVGYLTDTAIYKEPICEKHSTWLFHSDEQFKCHHIKGTLEVPQGTIVKQLNFQ